MSLCVEPLTTIAQTTRLSATKATYNPNDPLVYKCVEEDGRWGYVTIRCGGDTWGNKDRTCGDGAVVEAGSIAGICVAIVTILITVSFVIVATLKSKANKSEDIPMGENGEATAVKAQMHVTNLPVAPSTHSFKC